ncbi:MAG TPA: ABC transporter substrate-binding protein [Candidatus Sulfotelmatobacter sp.]|nr:ABC transporter substrate-binding protein [Candidatus Sulfotelmatobacter sp.]
MKRFAFHWLAVSSLLLTATAHAETRPQYGGTLRLMMHAAPATLDPADSRVPDSFARRSVTSLIFDTLVVMDATGRAQPGLADSWQAVNGGRRWQFQLRRGVKFHDGTPLTTEIVAASLRFANPEWSVRADADSVTVDTAEPRPELPAEVALSRNAIVKRDGEQKLSGTGTFHIVEWQPGKQLTLAAQEDCWRGRPFLDAVEIEFGRSFRDQATALDVGKADMIEVAPEQAHHFSPAKDRLERSAPVELMALVFARELFSPEEKMLREALALSVERSSIQNVLLQGAGQAAGSLLPTWINGYGFVFSSKADLPKARQLRDQVQTARLWTIGYDSSDPLARLLVERIALNAKDAGLSLVPTGVGLTDLRLVRIPLACTDPWVALDDIAALAGLPRAQNRSSNVEELYAAEQSDLASSRVIPLFHLPVFYAASANLKNWTLRMDGNLDLRNAWLGVVK